MVGSHEFHILFCICLPFGKIIWQAGLRLPLLLFCSTTCLTIRTRCLSQAWSDASKQLSANVKGMKSLQRSGLRCIDLLSWDGLCLQTCCCDFCNCAKPKTAPAPSPLETGSAAIDRTISDKLELVVFTLRLHVICGQI